jgi:hypothetical protein
MTNDLTSRRQQVNDANCKIVFFEMLHQKGRPGNQKKLQFNV